MPSVVTTGTPPASRARLAAIDGGNDEKSGCVEGGMVEGCVVEGDIVVGTSATGSGGGSPADTIGLSLRGGIEIDGESCSCGCGGSGSTGAGSGERVSSSHVAAQTSPDVSE